MLILSITVKSSHPILLFFWHTIKIINILNKSKSCKLNLPDLIFLYIEVIFLSRTNKILPRFRFIVWVIVVLVTVIWITIRAACIIAFICNKQIISLTKGGSIALITKYVIEWLGRRYQFMIVTQRKHKRLVRTIRKITITWVPL